MCEMSLENNFDPELQELLTNTLKQANYVGPGKFIPLNQFNTTRPYNQSLHLYDPKYAKPGDESIENHVLTLDALRLKTKEPEPHILKVLENGNLVFLLNHDVTINLKILSYLINNVLKVAREDIYQVLGPIFVMHEEYFRLGTGGGNIINVLPRKLAKKAPELIKPMGRAFLKIQKEISKKTGKVIIIAPGGTTDPINKETGESEMPIPPTGVINLIKGFLGENGRVMCVRTEAREVFQNGKPQKGNAYIEFGGIRKPHEDVDEIKKEIDSLNPKNKEPAE